MRRFRWRFKGQRSSGVVAAIFFDLYLFHLSHRKLPEANTDTRTDDQRYQLKAKKTVEDFQELTGGGKPPPQSWDGGLKSDGRTIEQKLDQP